MRKFLNEAESSSVTSELGWRMFDLQWKWVKMDPLHRNLFTKKPSAERRFFTSLYWFVRTFANSVYSCLNMVIIKSFLYSTKRDFSRDLIEMAFFRNHPGPLAIITPLIRPDIIMVPCWLVWNWFYFLWWFSGKVSLKIDDKNGTGESVKHKLL